MALAALGLVSWMNPAQAASTWTGQGADSNWSTANNWNGNQEPAFPTDLIFAGSTQLANNNDLSGATAGNFTFDSAAGAFVIGGNPISLNGNFGFNGMPATAITQTVNLSITFNAAETIDVPTNATLALNGNLSSAFDTSIVKLDGGTLTLGGANTLQSGDLDSGTTVITGNTAFVGAGNSRLYVGDGDTVANCNGTLIIQPGANISVTGNFADAMVFGRDGGSATVIQNGGTFSYNPDNQGYLFVGAANNPNTRSTYIMNNGVFDMNLYTLGVGLGVDAGAITGEVDQVDGMITNVGKLDLGAVVTVGTGIYNLTGGTIAIGGNGITSDSGKYAIYLGGGTVAAEGSWSSALNMTLTGTNGPVTFNPAGSVITLSGILSGTGGLIVSGGGTLELSGANTYTGDTVVQAGSVLQLDQTGSSHSAFRVANGGILNLNYSGVFAVQNFYTNGVAVGAGTYNSGNMPGFIEGGGSIQIVAGISSGLWTGQGGNNSWSTAGNWDNNAVPIFPIGLTFAGSSELANNNNLSGVVANGIKFDAAAGAFVIGGNPIAVNGNITFTGNPTATVTQTVNAAITFNAAATIDTPTNATLALNGDLSSAFDSSIMKLDAGTLMLNGTNAIQSWDLDGGTTVVTGNTVINGGGNSRVYVGDGDAVANCNASLILQPGVNVSITGNFADAMVLGRDGGNATVIQNGGTFTFNPANQTYVFVGATSEYGTASKYNMNGGLFDMTGKTLGIALSDGGVISTGLVAQVGGVITNVGNLDLGAVRSYGHGVYTLSGGTIYIQSGGITSDDSSYAVNLGGGTVAAQASWASTLNMTLTGSNGPVTFSPAGNVITLSGVLSGTGGLTVAGAGTLELSGANNYTGDTSVGAGSVLQLDSTGSSTGAFRLANGAAANLNFSGTFVVGGLFTNGVAVNVGTYNSGNLPGFLTGTGNLQVSSGISTGLWTGQGTNANWSTAGNWNNGSVPIFPIGLTFAGNSHLLNTNDLSNLTLSSVTFDSAASPFVIDGNSIVLTGNIGFNGTPAAPVTQTFNLDVSLNANETVDVPANASLTLGGDITTANGFVQTDAGTLTLSGADQLTALSVNGGTNVITGSVTVNGTGGKFYIADGDAVPNTVSSLVIQPGATLSVIGSYGDAGVIGRDGGTGNVIQNGGLFSFNPANVAYLFVGASDSPNTHSTYQMHGGVLDMNLYTLGVGLGVNSGNITAYLNQDGGVITNVIALDLGCLTPVGTGVYNLTGGTIYIANNGIISDDGKYSINLGGGSVNAEATWSSSLNMTLTGQNGPVTFNPMGNQITLSGVLSGAGGLTVNGGGTLELSGANTYAGDTTVTGNSTLQLDVAGSTQGGFHLTSGSLLNLNYSGTYTVGNLTTNGVAVAAGTYSAGNLPGYLENGGSIQVLGSLPTTPTSVTFSVSSGHIDISWPSNYKGWILQQQTNSLSVGLSTNWVDVSGTAGVTSTNIPISAATPATFYRLRYPTP